MSNQVTTFNFRNNAIRVMEIDGQPWFVATDICKCLYDMYGSNASHFTGHLDDGEKLKGNRIPGMRGMAPLLIAESGMYKLVMRSDKPQAKAFQDWVTKEVLPSIRKTGSYVTGQPSLQENPDMDPLDLMMAQAEMLKPPSYPV